MAGRGFFSNHPRNGKSNRACSLLRETDLRIEDVAARSGFNTSTHLSQAGIKTIHRQVRYTCQPYALR